jgi:hypothetical protein
MKSDSFYNRYRFIVTSQFIISTIHYIKYIYLRFFRSISVVLSFVSMLPLLIIDFALFARHIA